MPRKSYAPTINRGQLKRLLTITRATSRYWHRDMLVILQSHVTNLYLNAGLECSSHTGRRTFAKKLLAETGEMETVALLRGHDPDDINVTALYIDLDHVKLAAMFCSAV